MDRRIYERAEALLPGNRDRLVVGGSGSTEFLPGSDAFRFSYDTEGGRRSVLVDPDTGLMQQSADEADRRADGLWSISPDGNAALAVREGNLWLRGGPSQPERQLTRDGSPVCPYASRLDWYSVQRSLRGIPLTPVVAWSPDSKMAVVEKIDQSEVPEFQLSQLRPDDPRPRLITYRDGLPSDAVLATSTFFVVDVASGAVIAARMDPVEVSLIQPVLMGQVWFSPDSSTIEAVVQGRAQRDARLIAIDTHTGGVTVVAEDSRPSVIDPSLLVWEEPPAARVLSDGRGIWLSERDGWAHLWLVDGEEWTQVTRGSWVVRELIHLDEEAGTVLFTASGREGSGGPLDRRLYRVALTGGEPKLLSPEPLDHRIIASPSGRWLVDCQSSPKHPPVSVLRRADDGQVKLELSRATADRLEAAGWRSPEPVSVLGADDETELHGLLYLPPEFDEDQKWPLLDVVYPGPQIGIVPRTFEASAEQLEAFAALGIVVLALDARGTPLRSKRFHDVAYGDLGFSQAVADHAAAARELSRRHAWLDAERVGILGNSGGGHMAVRALIEQPETYSVAVSGVGNHDNRRYHAGWGERYIGLLDDDPDGWRRQSNVDRAPALRGKLLLGVSELDANVHPSASRALIAKLVEADIDHDVILLPHGDHASPETDPYYVRRVWDFLCRNLIGAEPPPYKIAAASLRAPRHLL